MYLISLPLLFLSRVSVVCRHDSQSSRQEEEEEEEEEENSFSPFLFLRYILCCNIEWCGGWSTPGWTFKSLYIYRHGVCMRTPSCLVLFCFFSTLRCILTGPSCSKSGKAVRVGAGCYHRVVNFSYSINKQRCAVSYLDFSSLPQHGIYSRLSAWLSVCIFMYFPFWCRCDGSEYFSLSFSLHRPHRPNSFSTSFLSGRWRCDGRAFIAHCPVQNHGNLSVCGLPCLNAVMIFTWIEHFFFPLLLYRSCLLSWWVWR